MWTESLTQLNIFINGLHEKTLLKHNDAFQMYSHCVVELKVHDIVVIVVSLAKV